MPYLLSTKQALTEVIPGGSVVTLGDANQTYTTDQCFSLVILRSITAARTDTTPSAASIVNAIPGVVPGTAFYLSIVRTDANPVNLTIQPGAGVTITGTNTVGASQCRGFLVVVTNTTPGQEAVQFISLGASTI